ncbi:Gmad2 immunoglobulin-like domain-containing protein, partial [Streptomyces sp.]|uniref:Gmad2 immunoglobulin-like domain-containing protein n=1 Tax=Streptomyces sp. TaxID=1931 RepID=UPI002F42EA2A
PSPTAGSATATTAGPTTTTATTAPSGPRTTPARIRTAVYFVQAGKLSAAPRTVAAPATAAGALRALLAGPNAYERAHGRGSAIPSHTNLRSLAVTARVATVDLSGRYDDGAAGPSARQRLAQVVFTATRFPGIEKVRFAVDGRAVTAFGAQRIPLGRPVGRADFEDVSPAVLTESPLMGETVRTPVRVRGTANTFEAVFRLRVTDAAGRVAADVQVQATSGTGTRGTFDVTFPFHATSSGPGTLTAYYVSPADGRNVTVQRVPLDLNR